MDNGARLENGAACAGAVTQMQAAANDAPRKRGRFICGLPVEQSYLSARRHVGVGQMNPK